MIRSNTTAIKKIISALRDISDGIASQDIKSLIQKELDALKPFDPSPETTNLIKNLLSKDYTIDDLLNLILTLETSLARSFTPVSKFLSFDEGDSPKTFSSSPLFGKKM